ncbi:hypothetical protein PM082_013534 [Marasmius tenuissimus]|nr:hypothetical protein PM082_013534 [Marasmius tenuissimus]
MDDTCLVPKFGGELGEKFERLLLARLWLQLTFTVIKWIDQLPVHAGYWAERKFQSRSKASDPDA